MRNFKLPTSIVDNRTLKVVAAKRDELKDALVLVNFRKENVCTEDIEGFEKLLKRLNTFETSATWVGSLNECTMSIYALEDFVGKDIVIRLSYKTDAEFEIARKELEKVFCKARTVQVVPFSVHHIQTEKAKKT